MHSAPEALLRLEPDETCRDMINLTFLQTVLSSVQKQACVRIWALRKKVCQHLRKRWPLSAMWPSLFWISGDLWKVSEQSMSALGWASGTWWVSKEGPIPVETWQGRMGGGWNRQGVCCIVFVVSGKDKWLLKCCNIISGLGHKHFMRVVVILNSR